MQEKSGGRLAALSDSLKDSLRAYAKLSVSIDLAFIGNTSDHYQSSFGKMVDFDAFVFVTNMNRDAGEPLAHIRDAFARQCHAADVDFEMRIIEGPYKPGRATLERPVFVAHLGVFTEALYLASPALKRWAWRKYVCEHEPGRLARLAPPRPTLEEFVTGPKGLLDRCQAIDRGFVEMTEWQLPEFSTVPIVIDQSQPNFVECCFAHAASTARNHARALGMFEADRLENSEFFSWYHRHMFGSQALLDLMAHKARCRDSGFDLAPARARALALDYLAALAQQLRHEEA